jgi:DNA-binding transcriptional LysR family regulator
VHAISSISAMVQLVQGGFGVALLPRAAVARLGGFAKLKPLAVDANVQSLPIHASYRIDPTSDSVEVVVQSALTFTGAAKNAPKKTAKGKP